MEKNIENMNAIKLAFLGDTIFDFFTRNYLITTYGDKIKMKEMHKKNANLVCAKSQARMIEYLINEGALNNEELELYKHARNAHPHSKSKNSSIVDYRKATGFEALLAYIYLRGDKKRLNHIFNMLTEYIMTL